MTLNHKLYLYSFLANFRWLKKSYTAKIMLVAFLGTHVPLLTLLLSFVISNSYSFEMAARVMIIALLATLVGTAATLYALNHLLKPVIFTSAALQNYLNTKTLPELPTEFADEAGTLMADTSQTLHKLDELIHYITNYDELTGLPNRDLFRDRLHQILSQPENNQRLIAVFLLSIDDFTGMSHGLDHQTINLLLRAVGHRLSTCTAQTDIIAHLSGDEFALARIDINSLESVIKLSQVLLSTLNKPFYLEGNLIHITVSMGITINNLTDPNSVDQLLQQAHIALYQAKQQGRSQYQFYSPEINAQLQERLTLEKELHGALERGEMLVYYQPLIDLNSRQVIAMEALIRWQHPTLGLVSPVKFIPIAEANGAIIPIGEWVLRTACVQTRAWQLAGYTPIRISVNLSSRQFEQPYLVEIVNQILEETGLEASSLELEVTESFLMADIDRSVKILKQLRELGICLALDDFGTGYSSLNYLKRFPVNMLKIDRSFVQDVMSNPDSAAVTDAIIALAKSLRLKITAEGVETQEQLEYLQMRGCDEGQGYYFSCPVPADIIAPMLQKSSQQLEITTTLVDV
ncbi:putative bifunctional diguanylate cyclase/phosphodiesterase [Nostoc sp. 'Peltigera membranacea cyanobiont' 232]|uniref:putative bifunctional diguanylate cyclase/phosphodiesterase n=1 Tax=Nostoc sp. 'Peltigera membranacea cyanobiont' 232 TaxID=2014531 RepID=UPI000B957B81|nr:GGDEF domain-containing phosphodiesterase [Nostoc sp. 'Peltigera membranacea cyanobiont' 232]OYE01075.1 GGDEF-domain containing protein [Nostoc sp. 'Peltigera membranacea cyanobiont' 232]